MLPVIERIVIEEAAAGGELAGRLERWGRGHGAEVVVERGGAGPGGHAQPDEGIDPSKRTLRVVRHSGAVLKQCTGRTEGLLCCNLRVLTQTVGCPLDCSYCILQDYHNRSQIVVRADGDEILAQLAREAQATPRRLLRVCTGQVADSLALEPLLGFSAQAVRCCADLPNVVLELKTKTAEVEPLLGLPHRGRTIVSWSLSPAPAAEAEEQGAAPLAERLMAAARVQEAGYLVGFHLDPMITEHGASAHVQLVREALSVVDPARVALISLGTVRFLPAMRRTILARFPRTRVTLGELLPEVDGKVRLLAPLRVALYREVAEEIRRRTSEVPIYLCMEPERIWRRALGASHRTPAEVELMLARSLHRRFGLAPAEPRADDYPELVSTNR